MSHTEEAPRRNRRLRRTDASKYLREKWDLSYGPTTLAKLACIGGSPPMEYIGRIPTYPVDGLDTWAAAKISPRVNSTAELRRLQAA
ncbi:hypothetical protein MKK55_11450 [Methylobacterium sp. J-059]|uniref:hypothetical protein n=1 Tax=Methylobacterium sp. J-059 TaxID=2836643 RepID=UPI001FB9182E|nr:hypothetical protein [Methylobacterium sp. J-059]MCJ2039551.1 hypothetical protein [Methylobacterium sp. J-059]